MQDHRAFAGVRVLDLTRVLAGPYCTYQLALQGAEVIKIEPPGRGETIRRRAEADPRFAAQGLSLGFMTQASNKRFLTLDLDTREGQEIALALATKADVVVQNLRAGSAERRGLGYEQVKRVNPRVVFCAITAYGGTGPKRSHPAYDSVIQAWSGFMSITGTPQSAPLKAGPPIMDYATGIAAAYAIASALYQRTHTGTGQYIDLGMLDVSLMLMASVATAYLNTGVPPKPAGNDASSRAPASTTFNTAEGLLAIACNEEHQFRHLLDVLGLAALRSDPRYAEPAKRKENVTALRAEIQNALMRRTAAEWETALNAACVPAGRVRTGAECLAEPQVASRIAFHTFSAAASGFGREVTVPLSPFRFAHDGPRATRAPAVAGADSEAILRELGYDGSAIEVLKAKQVI